MKKIKNNSIYLWSIFLICIEQLSKIIIIKNLDKFPMQIIKSFIEFNYCENRGVAFSIGSGNVVLFIVLNIILICGLIFYYEKNKKDFNTFAKIAFALTISGGASNLLDRIFRGYVVDFIDINNFISFPVFNIADIFIVSGIIGLMFFYIQEIFKIKN